MVAAGGQRTGGGAREPGAADAHVDCVYRIDASDRIVYVGGAWDAFAAANGASGLAGPAVLGRPIWSFVASDGFTRAWEEIVRHVRRRAHPLSFPLPCDSPDRERSLSMNVRPLEDGSVEFATRLLDERRRSVSAYASRRRPGPAPVLRICRSCGAWQLGGQWNDLDVTLQSGRVFEENDLQVASSVCEDCLDERRPVAEELAERLYQLSNQVLRMMRGRLDGDLGSHERLRLMSLIRDHQPVGLVQLADADRVSASTVSRLVASLHSSGWLHRESDPADRRGVRVSLTEAGERVLDTTLRAAAEELAEAVLTLDDAAMVRLADGLRICEDRLEIYAGGREDET